MANYTIQQCLAVAGITANVKAYLEMLDNSKLPNARDKEFVANNQEELLEVLKAELAKYNQRKKKSNEAKQCYAIIDSLIKAQGGSRRIIAPNELLPKLQELKQQIVNEKQFAKVEDFISSSGMTKEQIIEYLNKK